MALALLPFFAACSDDDKQYGAGNPQLTLLSQITTANLGDSITYKVNCKDLGGTPLSTLKLDLYYGTQKVSSKTVRTKTDGDYQGKLLVPYYKGIPNGKAQLKLTLQNISFTKVEQTVDVNVTRPTWSTIRFVDADKKVYTMTPSASDPYLFTASVPFNRFTMKGHFEADAFGANGNALTWGSKDSGVDTGSTENVTLSTATKGNINVTFNVKTYAFGPNEELPITPITFTKDKETVTLDLVQGKLYNFEGNADMAGDDWWQDPDFFTREDVGVYRFTAMSGKYSVYSMFTAKACKVWPAAADGTPAKLDNNGNGAVYIIGGGCINKPLFSSYGDWQADANQTAPLAPIAPKKFQATVVVGKQLKAGDGDDPQNGIDFKFFTATGWGGEFGKSGAAKYLVSDNPYFTVKPGDGNLALKPGVKLVEGETYVFTIDCTAGVAPAKLTVVKK